MYIPLEVYLGLKEYTEQVDAWSIGMCIYEMLVKNLPLPVPQTQEAYFKYIIRLLSK